MAERRKIVVPVGSEPETPHFDAKETLLSARPVVPIGSAIYDDGFKSARPPFYKRSAFLVLVIIAAIGIGLAAGLGIANYRSAQPAAVVARPAPQPPPAETRTATVQPAKDVQPQQPALPEVKPEERAAIKDNEETKTDAPEAATTTTKTPAKAPATSTDAADEEKTATPPPATREKKRNAGDDESDDTATPRAQKRERRERRRDDETVDIPRSMQRASEQINRIREIFEGRQRP